MFFQAFSRRPVSILTQSDLSGVRQETEVGKLTLTFKELEQGEIPHGVGPRWRLDVGSGLLVVCSILHREEPDEQFWSANDDSLSAEGPKTEVNFLSFILMKLVGRHSFQRKNILLKLIIFCYLVSGLSLAMNQTRLHRAESAAGSEQLDLCQVVAQQPGQSQVSDFQF